ncbi:MAG: Rrf2 family transcriptional regulator [Deltaproteobacteria bacterium]|nr:Rrf2 family transcriptional regulator [Deltaproteobacteria bacterium]
MKLTTRSRYGVRIMVALADSNGMGPVFLKDIAKQEDLSEKYLSLIVIPLRRAGLIQSTRGAYGGYILARDAKDITVGEIVDVLEGGTCVSDCVENPSKCSRASTCAVRDIWSDLGDSIKSTLDRITLASLVKKARAKKSNNTPKRAGKSKSQGD